MKIRAKERLKRYPRLFEKAKSAVALFVNSRDSLTEKIHRHGLTGSARKVIGRLFAATVFRKDELLVFAAAASVNSAHQPDDGIEIRRGTLSELAKLSIRYPQEYPAEKLSKAVKRAKSGHQLQMAWREGRCVHVAWTGIQDQLATEADVGPGCAIPFEEPSLVIYDCWTPLEFRGQGIYSRVLAELKAAGQAEGLAAWISCRGGNHASRRGIEKAGFRCRYRAVRTRYGGFWEKKSVVPAE